MSIPLVLAVVLGLALATSAGWLTPGPRVGDRAPDFALADLDGNPIRLSDYRGRPVILNFWASWCLPECANEFPVLADALEGYADSGLAVIGIVYRDRSEAARAFGVQFGATWPLVMDPGESVARAYGVYGPPENWLIDADGRIVSRQFGAYTTDDLAEQLDELLHID